MDEYIKREEIRRAYEKLTRSYINGDPYIASWRLDEMIENLPAADVVPERYGRWIKESDGGTRCSVCNKRVRDVTGGWDDPVDLSDMPYCPKCGARMDEEAQNER